MAVDKIARPPSPLPKSPLRERSGQQLSVATGPDSLVTFDEKRQALRGRLNQNWHNAVEKFKDETGKDLGDFRGGKNDVLGTLRRRYAEDNEDTKRKDQLWATVEKALNCVEFIGNIAAEVGSMFFSPANVCFSALETLINIPQAFKRLRDSLQGLFNEIVNFLTNFQILERVDNQLGLDTALVEKTNDILIAMVKVCRLSNDIGRHRFLTVMGNVFLKDDKVKTALEEFRGLIEEQNKLTSIVTLEAVLQTRATNQNIDRTVSKIGDDVSGISVKMDYIQAFQTDDKNLKANQEQIANIDMALRVTEAAVRQPLRSLEQCRNTMLDNTMDILAKEDHYKEWSRSKVQRKLLFLQGEKGSGRTYQLAALLRRIYHERDDLTKGGRKLYVAYYAFRREDGTVVADNETPLHVALRVMAAQITRQSETYTKTLHRNLDAIKDARGIKDLWRELKLDDFEAPDDSVLYLFFDGLDQLKASPKDLKKALDPEITATNPSLKARRKLRLRIVFAGNKDTADDIGQKMPTIDMKKLNEPLLRSFVEHGMANMLRDGLVLKQSAELIEAVLQYTTGSFVDVLQRLDMIRNAVSMDSDFEELLEQIKSDKDSNSLMMGASIVDKVCSELSSEHQQQLKEVIYWAVYGLSWFSPETLEAALFLRRQRESLEPLASKIITRFAPAVILKDDSIMANSDVEQYLRNKGPAVSIDANGPSKITLEMKIENVDEKKVKQFIWDLNNAIVTERFEFSSSLKGNTTASSERIRFSFAEAQYTIIIRCLQTLNDEKLRSKTAPLMTYACRYLPDHIWNLKNQNCYDSLTPTQRRTLGQGVIGFLTDTECMDSAWSSTSPITSGTWIYDLENVVAMGHLLSHPSVLQELDPRDRRIAEKMTRQTREKPAPFLESMVMVAASRWLDREKAIEDMEEACFHNVNAYLRLLDADFDSLKFQPEIESSTVETTLENDAPPETAITAPEPEVEAEEMVSDSNIPNGEPLPSEETAKSHLDEGTQEEPSSELPNEGANEVSTTAEESDEDAPVAVNEVNTDGNVDPDPIPEQKNALEPNDVTADRVKEALEWSLKQLRLEPDFFVYQRVGRTLVDEDNAAAIGYLKQAFETAPNDDLNERLKAACALAEAYARNSKKEAYEALVPLIEELRTLRGVESLSDDNKTRLFETLTKAAGYLMDENDDAGAATLLEDALKYSPNDGQCRHNLINSLCKTNQSARAQELFEDWTNRSADDASYGPPSHFIKLARDDYSELSAFFHNVSRSTLHTSIVQTLTNAIERDGNDPKIVDMSALHFARGLALAITREDDGLQTAVKEWEACIAKRVSRDVDDDRLLRKSWVFAAQYYFDQYRRRLVENPQMSITEKAAMWRDLYDIVDIMQVQEDVDSQIVRTPWMFVAAFARLIGFEKDAKDILRPAMAMAIRILSDDDPENDSYGLANLLKVLRCYGDIAGVCSVWSCLDREKLATKREETWAAQLKGNSETNDIDTTQQPAQIPQISVSSPDNEVTTAISDVAQRYFECSCDGCGKLLESSEYHEIWSCTFCPNLDFCAECDEKLKNKQLENVNCGHDHVRVLMQHLEYDRDDVLGPNVKIGWRVNEPTDGKLRRYDGGRIVALDEWIDILAREWDVTRIV